MKQEIKESNGYGVSALILGIIGLYFFSFVLGTLAIIFGAIGMKNRQKYSKAGLILGIMDVCLFLIFYGEDLISIWI